MDQSVGKTRLEIDALYYNSLDIQSFALMLKDPSYCYKFYWLEAIVNLISEGIISQSLRFYFILIILLQIEMHSGVLLLSLIAIMRGFPMQNRLLHI